MPQDAQNIHPGAAHAPRVPCQAASGVATGQGRSGDGRRVKSTRGQAQSVLSLRGVPSPRRERQTRDLEGNATTPCHRLSVPIDPRVATRSLTAAWSSRRATSRLG
ncbi:unnamed protein product [Lampetra fluviatilis]